MWKRFVTNNFRFTSDDLRFRHAYIINVAILLVSFTLFFFSIYNIAVTAYYTLAAIEFTIFLMFAALLYYFHRTSNIKVTAYGILLLLFFILAAFIEIIEHREYALYWLIVFLPIAIFLLGRKIGLLTNALFLGYFTVFMLQRYGGWEPAVFDATSIINIVFASMILVLLIAYFDLSREEASSALERQTRKLEEEHAMLDRYVIVCTTDLTGVVTYASKAFYDLSGYSEEELIGRNYRTIRYCDTDRAAFREIWSTISRGEVWQGEVENRRKEGLSYWVHAVIGPIFDADGEQVGYRAIGEDITDRKRVEELAISDYLTKLYNRVKLDRELLREIVRAARYENPLCVILLDIDHFKNVNDTYGHQTGDAVLKQIARILKENSREVDTLGRWGGEEFLIITPSIRIDQGVQFAEKLRTEIEGHAFGTIGKQTASFGVAEYRDGDTPDSLTERVDKALYRAKSNGRNRVET